MDLQRLAKVMAMAASDNEAEALHALRTANRLLNSAGLDFVALASRLGGAESSIRMEDLEDTVFDLRNEIRHLRAENERLRQGPVNLAAAAQDAAGVIRLRAELDEARETIAAERMRAERGVAVEASLRADLAQALDVADRLTRQFEPLRNRAERLEAENRRLSLVAAALKTELDERIADQSHPLPPIVQSPPPLPAQAVPMVVHKASHSRRGKAMPVGQYALFQ